MSTIDDARKLEARCESREPTATPLGYKQYLRNMLAEEILITEGEAPMFSLRSGLLGGIIGGTIALTVALMLLAITAVEGILPL